MKNIKKVAGNQFSFKRENPLLSKGIMSRTDFEAGAYKFF